MRQGDAAAKKAPLNAQEARNAVPWDGKMFDLDLVTWFSRNTKMSSFGCGFIVSLIYILYH